MAQTYTSSQTTEPRKNVSLVKRTDKAAVKSIRISKLNNAYLQDGSKYLGYLRILSIVCVLGLIMLVGLLTNFSTSKTRIMPTTSDGKLITPPPIEDAVDENIVTLWITDVMTQSTTMGFHDYQIRLKEIRPFFSDRGWESFMRYMKTSFYGRPSIISRLDNDRLVFFGAPSQTPQILQSGLSSGVYTYTLRFGASIQEASTAGNGSGRPVFDLSIVRVSSDINPAGLAIDQWRLRP